MLIVLDEYENILKSYYISLDTNDLKRIRK
jgi:hypothetical protein